LKKLIKGSGLDYGICDIYGICGIGGIGGIIEALDLLASEA